MKSYVMNVADVQRELPFVDISDELAFASFVVISDTELVSHVAPLLAEKIGECEAIVTAEAKGIALAYAVSKELGLKKDTPTLTSCPTCGRTQIDLIPIAKEIEEYLYTINKDIHVAVMGCIVNWPGEAKEADLGIAGGIGEALIFSKGKPIRKIKEADIIAELKKEIDKL